MTASQLYRLGKMLLEMRPLEAHHGDCEGSDEQFHALVRLLVPECDIVIHPPTDSKFRAYCVGDHVFDPQPYLERDKAIVHESDHLIACPKEDGEVVQGSGTWYTVRYARGLAVPYTVLKPSDFVIDIFSGVR